MIGLFSVIFYYNYMYIILVQTDEPRVTIICKFLGFFLNTGINFSITIAKSPKIVMKKKTCNTFYELLYTYMVIGKHLPSP